MRAATASPRRPEGRASRGPRIGRVAAAALSLVAVALPASAQAATLQATPTSFSSVFSAAQGGDTLLLASGSYGSFNGGAKSSMVTIAPELGASVTMAGGNFGSSVRNVTIRGVTFTGPVEIAPGQGGLNLVFDNDTWANVGHAAHEGRVSISCSSGCGSNAGVQIKNSTFGPGGCSDGIQVSASGVEVGPNNEFKGITQTCSASEAHVDSIQIYGGDNVNIHDNYIHDGEQGIMSPDGLSTGYRITNNVIHTATGYPCMHVGDSRDGTITHNVCRNGAIRVYGGNQGVNSQNMTVRDNVASGYDTGSCSGCTIDHNLNMSQVTFIGGTGRCAWASASPLGTGSDGTNIGLSSCGSTTPAPAPAPPPPPAPVPPPAPAPAPTASFSYAPTSPVTGQAVTFDATVSTCSATPCTYTWEDDGTDGSGGTQWPLGTGTSKSFTFSEAGTKLVRLTVQDAQGQAATTMKSITVSSPTTAPPPPPAPTPTPAPAPSGLVASYGFDEARGTTIADKSGKGNTGTVVGPLWTASGKQGSALTYDGSNDYVTIPDAASLDLTTGMTVEAWVRPTAGGRAWRQAVLKETSGGLAYGLYAFDDAGLPDGYLSTGSEFGVPGPSALPLNAWSHIATTYDGTALRLYVNGKLAGQRSLTGSMTTSSRPLKIGGNAVWGEFFKGQIDSVKVYDRALSGTELETDMNAAA
jgi:hypothetical protein